MSTLGERIRRIRKTNQLSQKQFANIIGVSQGTLSELEKNKYKPSIDIIIGIQHNFKVELEWLVNGNDMQNCNTYCINLNEKEQKMIPIFRKLTYDDQDEILDFIRIKLNRYKT